jgi:hypothetical protein
VAARKCRASLPAFSTAFRDFPLRSMLKAGSLALEKISVSPLALRAPRITRPAAAHLIFSGKEGDEKNKKSGGQLGDGR